MKMRELNGGDIFSILNIIGKLNITQDFAEAFGGDNGVVDLQDSKAVEERGLKLLSKLINKAFINITLIRSDINELLADLTGIKVKDVEALKLNDYTSLVIAFFKKEEIKDFFKSIGSLLQAEKPITK